MAVVCLQGSRHRYRIFCLMPLRSSGSIWLRRGTSCYSRDTLMTGLERCLNTMNGNIDPAEGVLRGTSGTIRAAVLESYQRAGNPFIVNAGCEIPSGRQWKICKPCANRLRFIGGE